MADEVKTKKDFEEFLGILLDDYRQNSYRWENDKLDTFLEALYAYTCDVEGYYRNMNLEFNETEPTWQNFAQVLVGAVVYE